MDNGVITDANETKASENDAEILQQSEAYAINQVKAPASTDKGLEKKKAPEEDPTGFSITGNPDDQSTSPILNQWLIKLVGGGLVLALFVILLGFLAPRAVHPTSDTSSKQDKRPGPAQPTDALAKAPSSVAVESSTSTLHEDPLIPITQRQNMSSSGNINTQNPQEANVDYQEQMRLQLQIEKERAEAERQTAHAAYMKKVYEAPTTIYSKEQARAATSSETALYSQSSDVIPASNDNGGALKAHVSTVETSGYLQHTRMAPLSPYEVKAGTVIPSVMLSGINSDLPGQLTAQVSTNVYDTATGKYLLIPQGAKLVGTYEHNVVSGQKRVLIGWNRIIYPDSSSINLEAMPGQDQSGYAGFKDKANSHTISRFGEAIFLSAITAGVQLSQPRTRQGDYSYSAQQVIAGSLGMQLNQMGMQAYQGKLNQPPTLTIRPGYRFNVMVSKDIVIPPLQSQNQASAVPIQTVSRW